MRKQEGDYDPHRPTPWCNNLWVRREHYYPHERLYYALDFSVVVSMPEYTWYSGGGRADHEALELLMQRTRCQHD